MRYLQIHVFPQPISKFNLPFSTFRQFDMNEYAKLKRQMLADIVNNRIYKDEELRTLFLQYKTKNKHLDSNLLDQVIADVESEMLGTSTNTVQTSTKYTSVLSKSL